MSNWELIVSRKVKEKIENRHELLIREICEAFANKEGAFLRDAREDPDKMPFSQWFVAQTDKGKLIKVAFILDDENRKVIIKTAYEPNEEEVRIYKKYS